VLETTLAPRLASLVMPLLNDAVPLDKKLRLAGTAAELRLAPGGTPPKDWIVGWFEQVIYM